MGTYTSPDSLYKPAQRENGWAALVDTNFDTIQARLTTLLGSATSAASDITALESDVSDLSSGATAASGNYVIGTTSGDTVINDEVFRPFADNTTDIGHGSFRWQDLFLAGNIYLGTSTSKWQFDHSEGSTNTINIRAQGATNSKSLIRMMPSGTGESATTGDRAELTWMFEDVDSTDRGWVDMKTRHRVADDARFFHILTDRNGTGQQADRIVIEFDPQAAVSGNEFAIVRDAFYDPVEAGGGAWMFRLQEGTGITRIENNAIHLTTGNLVLGTASGDVVARGTNFRAFADNTSGLGSSSIRWTNSFFTGYIEIDESSDPAAPAANKVRFYSKDVGGKTAVMARFPTGAVQQIAIEP